MKKSAISKVNRNRSCGSSNSYLIKCFIGLLMGLLGYFLISRQKDSDKDIISLTLDIKSILPPSGSILKSIAIPRVSGTEGNVQVRNFIKSQFSSDFWLIEEDSHVIDSLHGQGTVFSNLIVTLKQDRFEDRLILAAHYDSKLLEAEGSSIAISDLESSKFIGASDSAWSCALMISIGQAIQQRRLKTGFQLIFFDGEEAVRHWSSSDSLYGSRALASKWSKLPFESSNSLQRINLMVLLDLLGTGDGDKIYSFHPDGTKIDEAFKELIRIERNLYNKSVDSSNFIFQDSNQFKGLKGNAIEDDHTPFLPFGVPVLHLIPLPFPSVWHTPADTIEALDPDKCEKLSKIIFKFIYNKLT